MPDRLKGLINSATSADTLIDSIVCFCPDETGYRTYPGSSRKFFDWVREAGRASRDYVAASVVAGRNSPQYISQIHQGLVQVKTFWSSVHRIVKAAADADTMNMPGPLVRFAENVAHQVPRLEQTEIAILLTDELNYVAFRSQHWRELSGELRKVVRQAPIFPPELALIALPYCNATRLFPNVLILHELGHHLFEKLGLAEQLSPLIEESITNFYRKDLDTIPDSVGTVTWFSNYILAWCEEIYCDLFAVYAVGPSFTFALVEIFDVLGLLDETSSYRFKPGHPAEAFRLRQHVRVLRKLGWWDSIADLADPAIEMIRDFESGADAARCSVDNPVLPSPEILEGLLPAIIEQLENHVKGLRDASSDFESARVAVSECLSVAIVPSAAVQRKPTITQSHLINASHCFVLDGFDQLLENTVEQHETPVIEKRSQTLKRLETWVMKALEDITYPLAQGS